MKKLITTFVNETSGLITVPEIKIFWGNVKGEFPRGLQLRPGETRNIEIEDIKNIFAPFLRVTYLTSGEIKTVIRRNWKEKVSPLAGRDDVTEIVNFTTKTQIFYDKESGEESIRVPRKMKIWIVGKSGGRIIGNKRIEISEKKEIINSKGKKEIRTIFNYIKRNNDKKEKTF